MRSDEFDESALSVEPAFPCTQERRGIWTLWWQHEVLRGQLGALDQNSSQVEIKEWPISVATDRRILLLEMDRIRRQLAANGLFFLGNE